MMFIWITSSLSWCYLFWIIWVNDVYLAPHSGLVMDDCVFWACGGLSFHCDWLADIAILWCFLCGVYVNELNIIVFLHVIFPFHIRWCSMVIGWTLLAGYWWIILCADILCFGAKTLLGCKIELCLLCSFSGGEPYNRLVYWSLMLWLVLWAIYNAS